MAFLLSGFYPDPRGAGQRVHVYNTPDVISVVATTAYFNSLDKILQVGDVIRVYADSDGNPSWFEIDITAVATDVVTHSQKLFQELVDSGAVIPGVNSVEFNDISVIIAATIADSKAHQGLFVVKDTSASGTAAHTLTLTVGTFDGTNSVATLNASNEALVVWFDSAGNGTIVENVGAVALS